MFKTIWSKERYAEEYKEFAKTFGDAPGSSMASFMGWHQHIRSKFHERLKAEGIGWEKDVSDDYEKLRNSETFRTLLLTQPTLVTLGDFHNLARKAIEETFGNLSYLDDGYPKLKNGTIQTKKSTFTKLLTDYGIRIDAY